MVFAPATDLRDYTQSELQMLGYWPPWAVQDTDRDQRPDVVAVVGKPSPSGDEYEAGLPLYASASLASKPVATIPHCTTVVVRKVGGMPDRRWYFVETPEGQRGWIPDNVVSSDICVR